MPLTDAQRRIYASAPAGAYTRECLTLIHPNFTKRYDITTAPEAFFGTADGASRLFQRLPFGARLPSEDGRGTAEMQLVIANVSKTMQAEIEAAVQPVSGGKVEPIEVRHRFYPSGETDPSPDPPRVLFLSEIQITEVKITGTASRADVVNADFPREIYRISKFPGLDR